MTDRALTLLVWGAYLAFLAVAGVVIGLGLYSYTH